MIGYKFTHLFSDIRNCRDPYWSCRHSLSVFAEIQDQPRLMVVALLPGAYIPDQLYLGCSSAWPNIVSKLRHWLSKYSYRTVVLVSRPRAIRSKSITFFPGTWTWPCNLSFDFGDISLPKSGYGHVGEADTVGSFIFMSGTWDLLDGRYENESWNWPLSVRKLSGVRL